MDQKYQEIFVFFDTWRKTYSNSPAERQEESSWQMILNLVAPTIQWILPYAIKVYWYIFFFLLIIATVGRKLKFRRIYIKVLDHLFDMAAVKLHEEETKEKRKKRTRGVETDVHSSDEEEKDQNLPKKRSNRPRKNYYELQASQDEAYHSSSDNSTSPSAWESFIRNGAKVSSLDEKEKNGESSQDAEECYNGTSHDKSEEDDPMYCKKCLKEIKCLSCHNVEHEEKTKAIYGPESDKTVSKECDECDLTFPLDATMHFAKEGMRAILDDSIHNSFTPEELDTWNLLSR